MGRSRKPVQDNSGKDLHTPDKWKLYKKKPRRYGTKEIAIWRGHNNYLYISSKFCQTVQEIVGQDSNIFLQLRYNSDLNAIWLRFEPVCKDTPLREGYIVGTSSMRFSICKFLDEFKLKEIMGVSQLFRANPYKEMDKVTKNKGGGTLPPSTNWIAYLNEKHEDL